MIGIFFYTRIENENSEAAKNMDYWNNAVRRKYVDSSIVPLDPHKPIVVIHENETGRNELFCDILTGDIFDKEIFIYAIENGVYPGYKIAIIDGLATPVSKSDAVISNNLG